MREPDLNRVIVSSVQSEVNRAASNYNFPEKSIPLSSVDLSNLVITGDQVVGGIIKNFSSTGIDDRATQCQITILDTHTIIEQPILTTGIEETRAWTIRKGTAVAQAAGKIHSDLEKGFIRAEVLSFILSSIN